MTTPDPDRDGRDAEEPRAPLDVDSTFAAIVAHWADEDDGSHPWPEQEDLDLRIEHAPDSSPDGIPDGTAEAAAEEGTGTPASPAAAPSASPGAPLPSEGRLIRPAVPDPFELPPARAEAELEERFIPPDPGPLPRGDLFSRLAWAGVLGGPLFLLIAAMLWRGAPQLFVLIAVGAFIGGFVALILRLPQNHDDDGDDGAVV